MVIVQIENMYIKELLNNNVSMIHSKIIIYIGVIYIGVIVSISNTASIITLALPKSDNNNNNIYIKLLL